MHKANRFLKSKGEHKFDLTRIWQKSKLLLVFVLRTVM